MKCPKGMAEAFDDVAFAWADFLEAVARSLRLSAQRVREGRGRR